MKVEFSREQKQLVTPEKQAEAEQDHTLIETQRKTYSSIHIDFVFLAFYEPEVEEQESRPNDKVKNYVKQMGVWLH